ncbi:two pore channel protein 1-like [Amphiura filiformis]|uniref:two pore channel protein 1-like n=1 Tax=Amphiura filiformis TaxID=82378 RepID=UPI003B219C90
MSQLEDENPLLTSTFASIQSDIGSGFIDDASSTGSGGRELFDKKSWELNYKEAAIYLQEGENNLKFDTHPKNQDALPAYILVHNFWFYVMDLCAAILIMTLALFEHPAVLVFQLEESIHASLELFGLTIIAIGLGLKMRWLGPKQFMLHKRTCIKAIVLIVMYCESITVLARQESHFRVTRALRPFFLIDCHYCGGVRRVYRQIFQSLPPILDMMVLLFYFLLIFSILGFYIFTGVEDDTYFRTIQDSFINLFVLMTTANFPDVMMPAYNKSRWASIYFITFLILELYFMMNLLLAVVYDTFTGIEKEKFKAMLLHQRVAASHAFKLLCSRRHPGKVSFTHFKGLLRHYRPRYSKRDVCLAFKTLNTNTTGLLTLQEFHNIYDVTNLKWKSKKDHSYWYETLPYPLEKPFKALNWFVTWRIFDYVVYGVIALNGIVFAGKTVAYRNHDEELEKDLAAVYWYDWVFVIFYMAEVFLKIVGLGVRKYLSSGWNLFDFVVTVTAVVGILCEEFDQNFYYIVILRPLRLLRLFKIKKRYRDVMGTLYVLIPRMSSVGVTLIIIYYFYAIIGMECFGGVKLKNCCKNSSVEDFYSNSSQFKMYFYLNNFDNIINSYVTLFELTVINNWHVIMRGIAEVTTVWSQMYFILFYLSSMVVVTIIIAFILEAFLFRMQYGQTNNLQDIDSDNTIEVESQLSADELEIFYPSRINRPDLAQTMLLQQLQRGGAITYRGSRPRTKADLSKTMYADEVKEWIMLQDQEQRHELQQFLVRQMSRGNLNQSLPSSSVLAQEVSDLGTEATFDVSRELRTQTLPDAVTLTRTGNR